ncbi:serine/threonine-protein kinase [Methylobacterium brachiatum]|uniref:Serine/threonine-protein kinase n=1 Tax=Methylobacterium brachiatum TaxID=269660 RepID=A0AAJ1TXF9_9HYPH|nr:serine/threonine-protein kinase [Methylobacterium brachiatum]MCB4805513.1 protein kinase [Methylobacterium brachiatum]MDQ0546564.1 serine/threonine-protein kinase [Methylobacterium brachiatum]
MREGQTVVDARAGARVGPGTRLSDLYEIDEPIAVGGMGEVFRGHAIETGDTVAIKVMRAEFAENATALALFRKEASALHNVHHGAVVRYFVFSVDRRLGLPFLAMEYVTGASLADLLKRGPLGYEAVDTLRRRLAGGLGAAHEAGIVHRDVTPDNIILPAGEPGRAKLIDFGIARLAETQTVIGDGFAGKYAYVSPEQCGLQGGEITPRSDIYSLGLVLAEASRGRALDMGGGHVDFIAKRTAVPDLAGVDSRLVPLLESMLRPDPRMRPQSMVEVEAWVAPTTRVAPPPRGLVKATKRGRIGIAVGGAAAALALGIGAASLLWPETKPTSEETGPILTERPRPAPPPEPVPPPSEPRPDATRAPPDAVPQPEIGRQRAEPPVAPIPSEPPRQPERARAPDPDFEPIAPPPAQPTMERVAAYVRDYRGGECFFLSPTAVSAQEAVIEAYGTTARPFADFDAAFKKAFGFEAKIQLRQVEPDQCVVVDLLARQAQTKPANVPKLRLDRDRLRDGEELRGTVDLGDAQNVALFLVERDGSVHDLARYVKRSGRQASFAVRLEIPPYGASRAQLVVAAGSRDPITVPRANSSIPAFSELRQAMDRPGSGFGLAVHQIKVGN